MYENNAKERWIDLSAIPQYKCGNKMRYDWKRATGISIKFKYNEIIGTIKILKYLTKERRLHIYIDGYTMFDYDIAYASSIVNCELGSILRRKIIVTNPDILVYLKDKNDAYLYPKYSPAFIDTLCPFCGYEKKYRVRDLTQGGFSCDRCGDGVSYPNKFMFCLLEQLQISFINEVTKRHEGFLWVGDYRYDFYFEKDGHKYFIEMDGGFHYRDRFRSKEEAMQIDNQKDHLAREHNINVIRVNCDYDKYDRYAYIKNSILQSELENIFNFNSRCIDWEACDKRGCSNLMYLACDQWNNGIYSTSDIATSLGVSANTIIDYLKHGANLGICNYSVDLARRIAYEKLIDRNIARSKPIMVYTDSKIIGVFPSNVKLCECSKEFFGKKFTPEHVQFACANNKTAYGYKVKYITHDEYRFLLEQLDITAQNEYCDLMEVI